MMKKIALVVASLALLGLAALTAWVEIEADYQHESLGGPGKARALVLFHPSRDAGFSDELSFALADGMKAAGFAVDRATLTRETPGVPEDYRLVAVVSNTYWWTPDLPTLRYLERARLAGIPAIGIVGGAGSTERSRRILEEAMRKTGASVIGTRSFWIWRPNDEARLDKPNREVAREMARQFGMESAQTALAAGVKSP